MDKLTEEQATTLWDSRAISKKHLEDGALYCYEFMSELDGKRYNLNYGSGGVIDENSTPLEIRAQVIADLQGRDYEDLSVIKTEETI